MVTNAKHGFHGCIDYIWLTQDLYSMCSQRLRVFAAHELRAILPGEERLPSLVGPVWPSDHWPLAVDIAMPGGRAR